MLDSLLGPPDPFTIEDPALGALQARTGSRIRPGTRPFVVEGAGIGRYATTSHTAWATPAGEAAVLPNGAVWRRRQHDVRVSLGGRTWHLRQRTWFAATVERDGAPLALLRDRRGDGHVVERWVTPPDALDGGLTHLLALWGGVGAMGGLSEAFEVPLSPVYLLRRRLETRR